VIEVLAQDSFGSSRAQAIIDSQRTSKNNDGPKTKGVESRSNREQEATFYVKQTPPMQDYSNKGKAVVVV
jgi:hypothetical protein